MFLSAMFLSSLAEQKWAKVYRRLESDFHHATRLPTSSGTTMVLGLLPRILSRDPHFYGLACVMAWGLAVGTVFTLIVVPTIYTIFFRIRVPSTSVTGK